MKNISVNIILGFTGFILLGTVILFYFGFNESRIEKNWLTALFTATSGVCVTGLTIIDISRQLNFSGQVVLLILIQAGGLGVFTISNWLIISFRKKMRLIQFEATNKTLGYLPYLPAAIFIKRIIFFTIIFETIGAVILFLCFLPDHSMAEALWLAIFHSVSAFCNAGFSLFANNLGSYSTNFVVNITVICLIIIGGIGFIVSTDIFRYLLSLIKGNRNKLSLQSKISLSSTFWLIFAGSIFILVFERTQLFFGEKSGESLMKAFFLSITSRTAGFNTIPTSELSGMTLIFLIFLMIVGASAGSTGGGIKTSTFTVIWAHIRSLFRQRKNTEIFNRTIASEDISRSVTLVFSYFFVLFVAVIVLQYFETNGQNPLESRTLFLDRLFEIVSALSTVGLSTGITPLLGTAGKIVLMICMFTGRIGLLAFLSAILGRQKILSYKYPEENIMVG